MEEFLNSLNCLQKNTIDRLRRALRGSHFTDVKVRTGGKDVVFEADWMTKALDNLCGPHPDWKHAFLFLSDLIDKTRKQHLSNTDGAVEVLLNYHMRKTRELLYAVVNGGLDEEYEAEAKKLRDIEMQPMRSTE